MQIKLHKNATTTLAIRKAIKKSSLSAYALAKKYGISPTTVLRWRKRDSLEDKSSRPYHLRTTLSKKEEERILFERKQFKRSPEEIWEILKDEIDNLYPMKIYRVLKRYNLNRIPEEFQKEERKIKKFRKYSLGFIHIDVLIAPKINKQRRYIFTSIDRISRIAYVKIGENKRKETSVEFLKEVISFYPYKINYILTDNGGEFTHKALPSHIRPKKPHPFALLCKRKGIKHRTTKFRHPWTNGMVERLNRRIKEKVLRKYIFSSIFEMRKKLTEFINDYNFKKRLRCLNYKTPAEYLKDKQGIIPQRIVI